MTHFNRRRVLFIAAAACAAPRLAAAAPLASWNGLALGAQAEVHLAGLDAAEAAPLFAAIESELARIEALFSLYRADSALSRLNRDGRLAEPPAEMLELLALASAAHQHTGGLFDPTVQPLFAYWAGVATGNAADTQAQLDAAALVGFGRVAFDMGAVTLGQGQALTLNGIAQGYATDRIADLLRAAGMRDVLVNIGEIMALGAPDAAGWQITLPDGNWLTLRDRAIATSALGGTMIGGVGHIFRHDGPIPADAAKAVSVVAEQAAIADALSTAAAVMSGAERAALAASGVELIAV